MSALEAPAAERLSAELLDSFFGPRAADVDAARIDVREGIAYLGEGGFVEAGLERSIDVVSRIARSDLTSAFSAWAHRMASWYVGLAPDGAPLRELLPDLRSGRVLGATALASATAHYLSGASLPVTFREADGAIHLSGRVPWASNLLPPFVAVTAAADATDPRRAIVVAFTDATPGVTLAPYPDLLALQATGSTSILLDEAGVPAGYVVSRDLTAFTESVLGPFLLLQSAFCEGLAARALAEAATNLAGPTGPALRPNADTAAAALDDAARRLRELAPRADRPERLPVPVRDLLEIRLRLANLATDAVRLELASAGGRGYLRASPTARRLREAAFLPIQAPTEVQLRWTLSQSA